MGREPELEQSSSAGLPSWEPRQEPSRKRNAELVLPFWEQVPSYLQIIRITG